jgi:hypothetical protein
MIPAYIVCVWEGFIQAIKVAFDREEEINVEVKAYLFEANVKLPEPFEILPEP